jgi:hypothetical protein
VDGEKAVDRTSPPKCGCIFTGLHGITSGTIVFLNFYIIFVILRICSFISDYVPSDDWMVANNEL